MHNGIHLVYKKKNPTMVGKLDMEKAYDRVKWIFLNMILIKFGFENVYRS